MEGVRVGGLGEEVLDPRRRGPPPVALGRGPGDDGHQRPGVAGELGMNMDQAIRSTYADLYRQARRTRSDLPENMVFAPEDL